MILIKERNMKVRMRGLFTIMVVMLLSVSSAFSELEVEKTGAIEVVKFPICRLKVKISDDGNAIDLNKLSVSFKEMQYSSVADSIVPIENVGNNNYYVYWTSKLPIYYDYQFAYFTYQGKVVEQKYYMPSGYSMPKIHFFTENNKPIIFFNRPAPGQEYERPLKFLTKSNGVNPIVIDSIKTFTEYFTYRFTGGYGNSEEPPGEYPDGYYYLSISFNGYENRYYTDSIVFYFNGNQRAKLDLIANSYKIDTKETINIVEPTKDSTWVPCFDKEIVWQGGSKGLRYLIDASFNGGIDWRRIGNTMDTSIMWNVQNPPTENALIRVYQRYKETPEQVYADSTGFNKVVLEPYAKMLVASTNGGKIQEIYFDETGDTKTKTIRYIPRTTDDEEEFFAITGMAYTKFTEDSRELAVSHHSLFLPEEAAKDVIFIYRNDENDAVKTINLDYVVNRMEVDEKRRYLALLPNVSNQVHIYNANTYELEKTLEFRYPITNFHFTPCGDSLLVSLMSNEVIILSSIDFQEISRKSYSDLPMITKSAMSPDGHFLALATESIPTDVDQNIGYKSAEAPIFVYETKTGVNIKAYYANRFSPMGMDFSPFSNSIIVGSHKRNHIAKRDLNNQFGMDFFNFAQDSPNDEMTSYSYASRDGHKVAATMSSGELYINNFAYTESGKMKEPFVIRYPHLKIEEHDFQEQFIDHYSDHYLKTVLCNIDSIPMIFHKDDMLHYKDHYTYFLNHIEFPDTLQPGECREFHITYHAIDTGLIVDTIEIISCGTEFRVPLKSYSKQRNIDFYEKEIDFGEGCLNTPKTKVVNLLRNLDDIPLKIKQIKVENIGNYANFRVVSNTENIEVPPNQDLFIEIEFTPANLGDLEANLHIFYTDNPKFSFTKKLKGVGIGGNVEFSHEKLFFLPGENKRQLTIKNTSDREMKIKGVRFQPMQVYTIHGQLPITLQIGETATFEVECLGEIEPAKLNFDIEPCAIQSVVYLNKYSATSTLKLLDKNVDPRTETSIDVHLYSEENAPYKGIRSLESEFTVAEKIFIPFAENSVVSEFGNGRLLRNEVVDGLRHIKFRIDGDFPKEGVIASIKGYAGLTEPTEADMAFNTSEDLPNFGSAVTTHFKPGKFRLVNICGGKMLFWNPVSAKINKVFPNPADKSVFIDLEAMADGLVDIDVYNQAGSIIKRFGNIELKKGNNSVELNTTELENGSYNVIIKSYDSSVGCRITIIK